MYTGVCAPVTIIYARGTAESGNVGFLAGPPFFDTLRALIGTNNVAVQGVDYAADTAGFFEGGDIPGSELMATLISAVLTACPSTKLCISGYSQGSQVVHKAATLLPAATMAKVDSAVLFGDPYYGSAVQGVPTYKTLVLCHTGDDICAHGDLVLGAHMDYAQDALTAAEFVVQQLYVP
ncbi:carbohydrate esterase family 5 protein [Mollisia scopiformis]|uniref:cutinase n=1 Tax=Mollisia scopiformis TaxID=149040 RepID=A0A194WXR2_MOLSC|nr:carbohydrate esterase family 5 protein [Mollisia scopiformis]KUJ12382.1 carbohydrate esterase family 5 protein [Mollisia scopiformis]